MSAVFKREFFSYFKSPVGYIAIALFSFLSGFIFIRSFTEGSINISSEILGIRSFFVLLVPIVTMGLLAEDRKRGTDVIYYTTPISLSSVVIGKFLAAMALFGVMFINIIIHIIVVSAFDGKIDAGVWGSVIVYFVLAALFVAIGIFASAISDSQIVAAIASFIMIMVVQLLPTIGSFAGNGLTAVMSVFGNPSKDDLENAYNNIGKAFSWLDPMVRTNDFQYGIFSIVSIVFCLSFAAFFLFLCYRVLEKKRWSQA